MSKELAGINGIFYIGKAKLILNDISNGSTELSEGKMRSKKAIKKHFVKIMPKYE